MAEDAKTIGTPAADNHLEEITRLLDAFLRPERDPRQIRKREQILHSATDQFVAHGYKKTSMQEVAQAAGVAKGTVYLYYQNKADLLFHAIALQNQLYMDELADVLDPALPPVDQLRGLIALSIILSQKAPLIARVTSDREMELVLREIDDDTLSRVNQMKTDVVTSLIASATDGAVSCQIIEGRARMLIDILFAAANGGRMIGTGMPLEEYAHALADVLVEGIVPC